MGGIREKMKAKEYAEKFVLDFANIKLLDETIDEKQEKVNKLVMDVVLQMGQETVDVAKNRGGSNSALNGAMKEGKAKWFSFASLVNKTMGGELIKHDGFENYWNQKLPELTMIDYSLRRK